LQGIQGKIPDDYQEKMGEASKERISYYLNVLVLEQIADHDPKIKQKFLECLNKDTEVEKKQALIDLIQHPEIGQCVKEFHLEPVQNLRFCRFFEFF
jgi:hypothetical protein